ncbi:hypothetical protein PGKDCPLP_04333 [Stenotrophomonas maltophilia]|nr:hypothetical protein PGKDCPLP_04333 [Stenotrophomonas maltophilia]
MSSALQQPRTQAPYDTRKAPFYTANHTQQKSSGVKSFVQIT